MSYGLLQSMPIQFQRIALHLRNLVAASQSVPDALASLLIIAIPKLNAIITGYAACRPISLYEVLFKMTTGSVHDVVSEVLQTHSIMHPNQFFGVKHCGVVNALQLVLHSMELYIRLGKRVVIKSADVAGAFPRCAIGTCAW